MKLTNYGAPLLVSSLLLYASCSEQNFTGDSNSARKSLRPSNPPNSTPTSDERPLTIESDTAAILTKCASMTKKTKKLKVDFAADTKGCEWGVNGNLNPSSSRISAVEGEFQSFGTDEDAAAICGLSISAQTPTFVIDDEVIFTLNNVGSTSDYVLYSDWFPMKTFADLGMKKSSDVIIFDRTKLIGFAWRATNSSPQPECAPGVTCDGVRRGQSRSGVVGVLDFKMTPDYLKHLPPDFLLSKQFKLGLWADGDDDSSDCKHTAVSFDVEISYISK